MISVQQVEAAEQAIRELQDSLVSLRVFVRDHPEFQGDIKESSTWRSSRKRYRSAKMVVDLVLVRQR